MGAEQGAWERERGRRGGDLQKMSVGTTVLYCTVLCPRRGVELRLQ